jgi:hypothetical protein
MRSANANSTKQWNLSYRVIQDCSLAEATDDSAHAHGSQMVRFVARDLRGRGNGFMRSAAGNASGRTQGTPGFQGGTAALRPDE